MTVDATISKLPVFSRGDQVPPSTLAEHHLDPTAVYVVDSIGEIGVRPDGTPEADYLLRRIDPPEPGDSDPQSAGCGKDIVQRDPTDPGRVVITE